MSDQHGDSIRDDIFSKAVRAGKRTYFFDVKSTRGNDLYLTITESKKRFHDNGDQSFEKHKIFLYKEDFDKFVDGLGEAVDYIKQLREGNNDYVDPLQEDNHEVDGNSFSRTEAFTSVDFEDLED